MSEYAYYVYLHRRGDTNEVFYVGKGKGNRSTRTHGRNKWWKNIVEKAGFSVEYVEKGLSETDAFTLEVELIKFYRECGHELCNITNGGEGTSGMVLSEDHKQKIAEKSRGRKHTDAAKKIMSECRKGVELSDDHKKKLSESAKRHWQSPDAKVLLSLSIIGRRHSEETKRKMSEFRSIPVKCSNGITFSSGTSAVEWLHSNGYPKARDSSICKCCKGQLKTAYGFGWTRLIDDTEYIHKETE